MLTRYWHTGKSLNILLRIIVFINMNSGVAPKAKKPDQVAILMREGCGYCARAKQLLKDLGYAYAELSLDHRNRSRIVGAITGAGTVPQVFVNGERIGGLEELERWAKKAA